MRLFALLAVGLRFRRLQAPTPGSILFASWESQFAKGNRTTKMKTKLSEAIALLILGTLLICSATSEAQQPEDKLKTIKPVLFTAVHLDDEFWAPRIETNRSVTIPYAFGKCEETGRVENFVRAAKRLRGEPLEDDQVRGYSFDDTDIYKILEGAAFGLSVKADPKMKKYLDGLIEKVAAAQEPDRYLYTARTINPERME